MCVCATMGGMRRIFHIFEPLYTNNGAFCIPGGSVITRQKNLTEKEKNVCLYLYVLFALLTKLKQYVR